MVWDSEQYWRKAVRYAEIAAQAERDEWERPFWLSLSLEFLARSSITRIHPALNADPEQEGSNLLYAFGIELKGQPKSLPIHAVFLRLQKILPEQFNKPRREFCDFFSNLRNQELHTCELPFERLRETQWLARFYDVCSILCLQLGKTLIELFGKDEAATAARLIEVLKADKVTSVKSKISAHQKVFEEKPQQQRTEVSQQQAVLANTWYGMRTKATCPACGSLARLQGSIERVSKPIYEDGSFFEKNIVIANRLECGACGLVLADIDELHIAQIEPHFAYFTETELHDYQQEEEGEEYTNM